MARAALATHPNRPTGVGEAVLICNGPSGESYSAPDNAYSVCLNAGFTMHRKESGAPVDAAYSVDCPFAIQDAWGAFPGWHVQAEHVLNLQALEEPDPCIEVLKNYSSATFCALDWLRRKGYRKVTVVGMDVLWGHGHLGLSQREHVAGCAAMHPLFPEGLFVRDMKGITSRVSDDFLRAIPPRQFLPGDAPLLPERKPEQLPAAKAKKPAATCAIPQTMVELDVSPGCTRACAFCAPGIPAERRKQKAAKWISIPAHNGIIDELVTLGYNRPDRWLCYCGHGEPLMHPGLPRMLRYARAQLPDARIALYTNGDRLDIKACCAIEAADVDAVILDIYDAATGPRCAAAIAASSLCPDRVRIVDHTAGDVESYSSRCSTVKAGDVASWLTKPCRMPEGKLFLTDDGNGKPAALLCCEDYARKTLKPLAGIGALVDGTATIREALAVGKRGKAAPVCSQCDRDGGHPTGFDHVRKLTESKYWPAYIRPPQVIGKRLVVLPVNGRWAHHAEILATTIAKHSTMNGDTLILWNDDAQKLVPAALKAIPGVTVWEFPGSLGWCGIARGIAKALRWAVDKGYDWVIKLDTDTAIMLHGWDALLCADCPKDSQAGTYMDVTITGQLPASAGEDGLFNQKLLNSCRWARGFVASGRRGWDHIQGGCYVIGLDALKRIDEVVGLGAEDQEAIASDAERIGEDVYIDTKCKIARVPQRETLRARSWYREPNMPALMLKHARYERASGVACLHPVKDIGMLQMLAGEIR